MSAGRSSSPRMSLAHLPLFVNRGGGRTVSTHNEVDSQDLLTGFKSSQREWQLPLVFFSILLALWTATWCGVYLLL